MLLTLPATWILTSSVNTFLDEAGKAYPEKIEFIRQLKTVSDFAINVFTVTILAGLRLISIPFGLGTVAYLYLRSGIESFEDEISPENRPLYSVASKISLAAIAITALVAADAITPVFATLFLATSVTACLFRYAVDTKMYETIPAWVLSPGSHQ